jgi:hypothetical protein
MNRVTFSFQLPALYLPLVVKSPYIHNVPIIINHNVLISAAGPLPPSGGAVPDQALDGRPSHAALHARLLSCAHRKRHLRSLRPWPWQKIRVKWPMARWRNREEEEEEH